MNDLTVVLCSYNGEQFIEEQLNSILNQTLKPNEIIVSDDGSTDNTIEIVEKISLKSPIAIRIFKNLGSARGPAQNFSFAAEQAQSRYIAFADQDDVWIDEKIEMCLNEIKILEAKYGDIPLLVHSDLSVVNESLQVQSKSFLLNQSLANEDETDKAKKVLLVQNYVTGCTIVMNRKLKDVALPIPKDAVMHDWWLALCAAFTGKIGFVDKPTVFYRQHGNNSIGAHGIHSLYSIRRLFQPHKILDSIDSSVMQVSILRTRLIDRKVGELSDIENYLSYIKEGKILHIYKFGIHKQNFIRNILFYFILFLYNEYFVRKYRVIKF